MTKITKIQEMYAFLEKHPHLRGTDYLVFAKSLCKEEQEDSKMNEKTGIEKMVDNIQDEIRVSNIGNNPNYDLKEALGRLLVEARSLAAEERAPKSEAGLVEALKSVIASPMKAQPVEPLAVLADKRRIGVSYGTNYEADEPYRVTLIIAQETKKHFQGDSYAACEAKAREWLNGLEDKK